MPFRDSVSKIKHITEACDLNILVWGPGKGSTEHFQKRQKIQREISTCFRNADVRFS